MMDLYNLLMSELDDYYDYEKAMSPAPAVLQGKTEEDEADEGSGDDAGEDQADKNKPDKNKPDEEEEDEEGEDESEEEEEPDEEDEGEDEEEDEASDDEGDDSGDTGDAGNDSADKSDPGGAGGDRAGASGAGSSASPSEGGGGGPARKLKNAADTAYYNPANKGNCNMATAQAAALMGNHELEGKCANKQVQHMRERWKEVSAAKAQELANQGKLVVAGREETKKDAKGNPLHGHTMVVVPGELQISGRDKMAYPMVEGLGTGSSDGSKSANFCWDATEITQVHYYTPPDDEADEEGVGPLYER
jgi:hypothetical protein